MDKEQKIKAKIESLHKEWRLHSSIEAKYRCEVYKELLEFIDPLPEEQASKDLEDFAKEYSFNIPSDVFHDLPEEKQALWKREIETAIVVGAEWQKEHDSQKFINEFATFTRDEFNAEIKQVKKETTNKAIEWLYQQQLSVHNIDEFISDFKKYMEDEK